MSGQRGNRSMRAAQSSPHPPPQSPANPARRAGLVWLAATAWPQPAWPAATDPGQPPPAMPPRALGLPHLQQQTLANGLTLLTASRRCLPLVNALLVLRVGAEADPTGRPGVAAMTATLLAKGALRGGRPVGAAALALQAESLGAALDTGSGWRSSSAGLTVTTPLLPAALALLADVMRRPLLAADELARARAQALDAWRLALASPGEVAALALRRAFWGDTAYGAMAGDAALRRLTDGDLARFHRNHYHPADAALVLAGDVDPDEARRLAERLLGSWQGAAAATSDAGLAAARGATSPAPRAAQAPVSIAEPLLLLDMPGSGQTAVALAAPYLGDADPDDRAAKYVGQVANAVLGGGFSARLNQELRVRRGLSYGVFSQTESSPPGGMLMATAMTRHASAAQVLALMRGELLRLADAPPSPAELAARQAALLGSFARRLDSTAGIAALVEAQWQQRRPIDELARRSEQVLAVTPAQVQAFARRHWSADRLRAVVAGDLAAGGDALATAYPKAPRLPLAGLDLERLGRRAGG